MTKLPTWLLPFMFVATGATALGVGYRYVRAHPVAIVTGWALALAALGWWYAAVRQAEGRVALRTVQGLTVVVVALALAGGPLLRMLLGHH